MATQDRVLMRIDGEITRLEGLLVDRQQQNADELASIRTRIAALKQVRTKVDKPFGDIVDALANVGIPTVV